MKLILLLLLISSFAYADQRIPPEMLKPIPESKLVYDRDEFHTDERDTGRKFDGKTVFRKCMSGSGNNLELASDAGMLINQYGHTYWDANSGSIPMTDGSGLRRFYLNQTTKKVLWSSTNTASTFRGCAEYTKQ